MTALWTTAAMVESMGGRPIGDLPESVDGISIDTRTLEQKDAFFAIRGERFDGHDFASAAMAGGAALLVVAEARLPALGRLKIPMIVVDDVLRALERLAVAARKRTKAQVIAVTGSAGKTTTKEALRQALAPSGRVHASHQSFNNHWGVPLTLARMPKDSDFGIFEIGMNHAGEIRPLVRLVKPHVAIVTLIAPAHLGHFRNLGEIADAKAEIFEGLVRGGHALINRDDPHWKRLHAHAKAAGVEHIHGFGEHRQARYKLTRFEGRDDASELVVRIDGKDRTFLLGAPGRHMAQNALAVLAAVHLAGGDLDKACAALSAFRAEEGRGRQMHLGGRDNPIVLIDESYNANPASMAAALDLLGMRQPAGAGRRIAVLGDMLELGEHAARLHAGLAGAVRESRSDLVFLGGPEMEALAGELAGSDGVRYCADTGRLSEMVLDAAGPGDIIMVKSSKGIGFSAIVDALKRRFPPIEDRGEKLNRQED